MSCSRLPRSLIQVLADALYRDEDGNVFLNTSILAVDCDDITPAISCEHNVEINDSFIGASIESEDSCGNNALLIGHELSVDDPYLLVDQTEQQITTGTFAFPVVDTGQLLTDEIKTDTDTPTDLNIITGAERTVLLDTVVWDDLRVTPGSFDRPGSNDPSAVLYYPNDGGIGTLAYEFQVDDYACFVVQLPHSYKEDEDIFVHIHWTPGARGNEENGKTVGWKIDYTWANIGDTFPDMQPLDLSDVCDGTDHKHQMTSEATLLGAGKNISSMILCNIRRSDTGTDDTWVGTISGQLPLILEVDFHYPIDTIGSRQRGIK